MDANFEFIDQLKKELAPIDVSIDVEFRKQKYYITVDGTKTYTDPAEWASNWNDFSTFASYQLRDYVTTKPKVITPTRVEFKVGSLLDIIKHT